MDVNALLQNASATLLAAGGVATAGVSGTVESIGLFATIVNTGDNVRTIVGNNTIFSDNIQNYSANPYRRVDLTATIAGSVDHHDAIRLIKQRGRARAAAPRSLISSRTILDPRDRLPCGVLAC